MALERRGRRWTSDEEDLLFALVRSSVPLDEVAATLRRTSLAVCARVDILVDAGHLFERPLDAFESAASPTRSVWSVAS